MAAIPGTVSPRVEAILEMDPRILDSLDFDDLCGVLANLNVSVDGLEGKNEALARLFERAAIDL